MEGEIWKQALDKGMLIQYEVSNFGNVRHIRTKRVRAAYPDYKGYLKFNYQTAAKKIRTISRHRMVAESFIPRVPGKELVNHIDSDIKNNRADNLEWCTPKENINHGIKFGKIDVTRNQGQKHGMAKLSDVQVINIRHCQGAIGCRKLASLHGVGKSVIQNIWLGRTWRHLI